MGELDSDQSDAIIACMTGVSVSRILPLEFGLPEYWAMQS